MKKMVLAVALATMGSAAMAQGGYAGALIGMGEINAECYGSCDKSAITYKVLGGYEFANRFAVEVAYTNYGEYQAAGYSDIKADAFSAGLAYRWLFSRDWDGTLRGGVSSVHTKWSSPFTSDKSTDASLYAGFNVGYHFAQNAKLVAGVEVTTVKVADDDGTLVTGAVGIQFGF